MAAVVRTERRGAVAVITIDRPERRNALDRAALEQLLGALAATQGARAVVLTGAGGHFCAGADLRAVEDASFAVALRSVLDALAAVPCTTVAAVEGAALGAGTQLAIACDLRVAAPDATFGIPAAKLGLMVDHWTVQRLAVVAGHATARAMLLAAQTISGAEAVRLGFAQREGTVADALAWADAIAELAPLTVAGHKLMLDRLERPVPDDPEVAAAFERAWSSHDRAEGMAAFRERRRPRFEGR